MVSRRSTGPLRTLLPAVAVGLVTLVVVGCGAGQVTQTDRIEPAVDGTQGDAGDIALRDVVIAYPAEADRYRAGDDAPLQLTIVNTGATDDELTSVSTPAAAKVDILGDTALPARAALRVVLPTESTPSSASSASTPRTTESSLPESSITEPSAPAATGTPTSEAASSAPSQPTTTSPSVTGTQLAPQDVGVVSIVLTGLTVDLVSGQDVPITFVFGKAGQVTLNVPIGPMGEPRAESHGSE